MKNKILVVIYFIVTFLFFLRPVSDPDFPWHIKTGQYIVENREIPQNDPFTFSHEGYVGQKEKFILSQYWLAQIIYYEIYKFGGLTASAVSTAFTFSLIMFLIWLTLKNKGMYYVILFSIPAAIILTIYQLDTPQNFSSLFTFVLLYLLEKYRQDNSHKKIIYFVPPLMFLWGNMHGGFIFGVAVIIICALSEVVKYFMSKRNIKLLGEPMKTNRLSLFLFICFAAIISSFINPNSYEALVIAIPYPGYETNFNYNIEAYKSVLYMLSKPDSANYKYFTFWGYFGYICIVVLFKIVRKKSINLTSFALISFTAFVSLSSIRYTIFFIGITVYFIKDYPFFKEDIFKKKVFHHPLVYAFFFIFLLSLGGWEMYTKRNQTFSTLKKSINRPIRAANFLKELPLDGNIFNSYNHGAYFLYALSPKYKVFYDNRALNYQIIREGLEIAKGLNNVDENYNKAVLTSVLSLIPSDSEGKDLSINEEINNKRKPLWKSRVDNYKIDIIVHNALNIVSGKLYPLVLNLMKDDEWSLIYMDGSVLVFLRNKPEYQQIIAEHNKPKEYVYDEIVLEAGTALQNKTGFSSFYSNLGFALMMKKDLKNARIMIDASLALNENDVVGKFCNFYLNIFELHTENQV